MRSSAVTARDFEIRFSLLVLLSFFFHLVMITAVLLPDVKNIFSFGSSMSDEKREKLFGGRDIIVNINPDEKIVRSKATLLSEKDASARGYITEKPGDRWLNNSLDFKLKGGGKGDSQGAGKSSHSQSVGAQGYSGKSSADLSRRKAIPSPTDVELIIKKYLPSGFASGGVEGDDRIRIPDRNNVTRENSIFYSNTGMFSFNTAKFKNFKYFREMKDRIASNWYPPPMANSIIGGYAPGYTRIMAIQSQEVKIAFMMNRNGDVIDVRIVESMGSKPLDDSCLDSIRLSKSFGRVPDDITGDVVVIPFIFGYYTN